MTRIAIFIINNNLFTTNTICANDKITICHHVSHIFRGIPLKNVLRSVYPTPEVHNDAGEILMLSRRRSRLELFNSRRRTNIFTITDGTLITSI